MAKWENGDEAYWKAINHGSILGNINTNGNDVNARSPDGLTPLHLAAMYSDKPQVIKVLIKKDADIDARDILGRTPLHWAAALNKNPEITKELLENGAKPNVCEASGNTPLHLVAQSKSINPDIIMLLLEHKASGKFQDNNGKVPFYYAKENELLKDTEAYWTLNDAQY